MQSWFRWVGLGLCISIITAWPKPVLATQFAAPTPTPLSEWVLKSWSTSDGLPHNSVNQIEQSPRGHLWFTTWEGPVQFNGRTFEVFDNPEILAVPDAGMYAMAINETGHVFVGGARGAISHFDGEHWQGMLTGSAFINDLLYWQDKLWIATSDQGVMNWQAGRFSSFNIDDGVPSRNVLSLYRSQADTLFIGTSEGLAIWRPELAQFELIESIPSTPVRDILETAAGDLWVATDEGIFIADTQNSSFPFHRYPHIENVTITQLHQHTDDSIFVGTYEAGLARVVQGSVEWMGRSEGLPNNHVLAFHSDHEGSLWISTHGGLVQLRETAFYSFTEKDGLPGDYVRAISEDFAGRVWVGTSEGIARILDRNSLEIERPRIFADMSVLAISHDAKSQSSYVGTYTEGLYLVSANDQITTFNRDHGLLSQEVRSLARFGVNELFVGTGDGLQLLSVQSDATGGLSAQVVRSWQVEQGLPNNFITAVEAQNDQVAWVATGTGLTKVTKIDGDYLLEQIPPDVMGQIEMVFAIHNRPEYVLFGGDRGVLIYHKMKDQFWHLNRASGLPFEKIFGVTSDYNGFVWLATSRGMLQVKMEEILRAAQQVNAAHFEPLQYMLYSEADGMVSSQVNSGSPASFADSMGDVWFATAIGAVRVQTNKLADMSKSAPVTLIEAVFADQKPLSTSAVLPAETQRVEFEYIGLGLLMPEHVRYRVRLRGYDNNWLMRGSSLQFEYTELPFGDYLFEVQAAYPGGPWSDSAQFEFSVAPAFYQQSLFWVVVTTFAGLMMAALWRWRVRVIQGNEVRLRRLVREKTQELEQLARQDTLTQLPNRRAFDEDLRREVARSMRDGSSLCLAVLDIDHFKQINDQYLHTVGDEVLKEIARVIRQCIRDEDRVARWGGEEFSILLPHAGSTEAEVVCERIRRTIEAHQFACLPEDVQITVSIGIAKAEAGMVHSELLRLADQALYKAKERGRNRIHVFKA